MNDTIDLEELYNTYTSEEQLKESYERRTVPTGRYTFQAEKVTPRQMSDESPFWAGRKLATLSGRLYEGDQPRGRFVFDVSWDVVRRENGKMDGPSMLWGQLVNTLGAKGKSVGEIVEMARTYPLGIYVTESFKTPEGWRTARTEDERKVYRSAGYDAKNFAQGVGKVA